MWLVSVIPESRSQRPFQPVIPGAAKNFTHTYRKPPSQFLCLCVSITAVFNHLVAAHLRKYTSVWRWFVTLFNDHHDFSPMHYIWMYSLLENIYFLKFDTKVAARFLPVPHVSSICGTNTRTGAINVHVTHGQLCWKNRTCHTDTALVAELANCCRNGLVNCGSPKSWLHSSLKWLAESIQYHIYNAAGCFPDFLEKNFLWKCSWRKF